MNSYFADHKRKKKEKRTDKERMMCVSVSKKNEFLMEAIDRYSQANGMSKSEYIFQLIRRHHIEVLAKS